MCGCLHACVCTRVCVRVCVYACVCTRMGKSMCVFLLSMRALRLGAGSTDCAHPGRTHAAPFQVQHAEGGGGELVGMHVCGCSVYGRVYLYVYADNVCSAAVYVGLLEES